MGADRDHGLSRRALIGGAAAVPAAAWVAGAATDGPEATAAVAPSWPAVRRLFALDPRRAHL
ncbi:MAG TPA: hypothetical protein VGW10_10580, partial [Solirubrobacteraceae bacterium]|nr:hypothetical protein [Solirubrobacteraceae bacterium]